MTTNTRRYPRTMSEAFKGADYANAIECPPLPLWKRVVIAIRELLQ